MEGFGVDLVSTGGTAQYLKKEGLKAKEVSDLTGFPEILNGRVKTLHPKVHAPILFDRDAVSTKELKKMGSEGIDLVVVNLYPFETILRGKALSKDIIENITSEVAWAESSCENFDHVMIISDPKDYIDLQKELTTFQTRQITRKFFKEKHFRKLLLRSFNYRWFLSKKQSQISETRVFGGKSTQI